MESTIVITLQNAPEEFKLVIVPMYEGGSLGTLINVNASTTGEIAVPVESPLDDSALISVSVIYQIGPITGCIPGISIPVEGELRLQFVTAGCVTFIVPSEPLSGLNAFFNTITLGELKYLPDSITPDGILVKMGETVTGVPLSDGSFPSMYGSELKETVIAGTSNQVTVTPSYNGSTDTVTLTLSLPQDISTTSSPEFKTVTTTGAITAGSHILPSTAGTTDLGSASMRYRDLYCDSVNAGSLTTTGAITAGSHILPSTTGSFVLGNSSNGFRELRLARGSGSIGLGWSMRVGNQAELHLNASGDNRSEITFGTGSSISPSNTKWAFNSFRNSEGNHFALLRGPYLMGPNSWQYVLHVDGATAQLRYNIDTQSTSTTTGCATFAGGVGIAKNLHVGGTLGSETSPVGGIYLSSPGGVPSLLSRYENFNINVQLTGPWSGTIPLSITVTVIGTQVFISVPSYGSITGNTATVISTPVGALPSRVCPNSTVVQLVSVTNANVISIGTAYVDTSGIFSLKPSIDNTSIWNHSTGSVTGWDRIELSYTL